jgi:hypothetical protein
MKVLKAICFFGFVFLVPGLFAQNQRAVLIKGNEWQTGIPGFGINTFPALFGEYLTEPAAVTAVTAGGDYRPLRFMIRVSGQALFFDPGLWQPRPGVNSAMQQQNNDSLLIAIPYTGQNDTGTWTILFQFPRGPGEDANSPLFSEAEADRLIRAWTGRFGYFLSLVKNFADISLPAVVVF